MKHYYVYSLASKKDGVLYIGFTDNLERRMAEHKSEGGSVITSKYKVKRLVYFEQYEDSETAFIRERQLKKWKRAWKIELVEKENSDWLDLAYDW